VHGGESVRNTRRGGRRGHQGRGTRGGRAPRIRPRPEKKGIAAGKKVEEENERSWTKGHLGYEHAFTVISGALNELDGVTIIYERSPALKSYLEEAQHSKFYNRNKLLGRVR
jgi:hypothetical protein